MGHEHFPRITSLEDAESKKERISSMGKELSEKMVSSWTSVTNFLEEHVADIGRELIVLENQLNIIKGDLRTEAVSRKEKDQSISSHFFLIYDIDQALRIIRDIMQSPEYFNQTVADLSLSAQQITNLSSGPFSTNFVAEHSDTWALKANETFTLIEKRLFTLLITQRLKNIPELDTGSYPQLQKLQNIILAFSRSVTKLAQIVERATGARIKLAERYFGYSAVKEEYYSAGYIDSLPKDHLYPQGGKVGSEEYHRPEHSLYDPTEDPSSTYYL